MTKRNLDDSSKSPLTKLKGQWFFTEIQATIPTMSDIRTIASSIVHRLTDAGYTSYFAGGWVRDTLLGLPSPDIDIATEAPPEIVIDLFPKTVKVGAAFGVVMVIEEGVPFEVATFRRDGLYISGRRPETVEYSTAEEDAQRRDFTINGMFWDPLTDTVIDHVGGQDDLEKGLLRAIGDPEARFEEDRLRMVRAVRILGRFNFCLDEATRQAIISHAHRLFPAVAMERVWQELNKMADFPGFERVILLLHDLGLLQEIFPELRNISREDLAQRTAPFTRFPEECPTILYILHLFSDIDRDRFSELCRKLRTSNQDIKLGLWYLETVALCLHIAAEPVDWVRLYADARTQLCLNVYCATLPQEQQAPFQAKHQQQQQHWAEAIVRKAEGLPVVTSQHLMNEGIPPGRMMGDLLAEAERLAILHELKEDKPVIALLKQTPIWPDISSSGGSSA